MDVEKIGALDRASVLHPFTHLHDFTTGRAGGPVIMETGRGIRVKDAEGREFIDGFSGLYCVNIGYGRTEVAEAISRQAHRMAYFHTYAGHTTDELAILSDRLVRMAPGRMSKIFFGMSGSDANETQVKLVWYYNHLRGKPAKNKIISRRGGYHGSTVMAGSLTGMDFYHANMGLPLPGILHTGSPHHYSSALPGETEREFSARRAAELQALIEAEGPETVAAFIAEPVIGTGGIIPPPEGYWDAIQTVLRNYDVLLIADEVITGFGRIGTMFGSDRYGMQPDLVTIAKGLTSAYFPLSGALVSEKISLVMEEGSKRVGVFNHGYTYSGHPIGAAAANAVLDIVERENLPAQARATGAYFQERLVAAFAQLPLVGEVRGIGMLGAVEFVGDRDAKTPYDGPQKISALVAKAARERGLIGRSMPFRDVLGFAPPLTATKAEIDEIVSIAESAVRQVMDDVTRQAAIT